MREAECIGKGRSTVIRSTRANPNLCVPHTSETNRVPSGQTGWAAPGTWATQPLAGGAGKTQLRSPGSSGEGQGVRHFCSPYPEAELVISDEIKMWQSIPFLSLSVTHTHTESVAPASFLFLFLLLLILWLSWINSVDSVLQATRAHCVLC